MPKRIKTDYPGVFFREAKRIGGKGIEKVFYAVYKKDGKVVEEKAGRQYADNMTPAKAAGYRADRIENKRSSRKEIRERIKAVKEADKNKWTINRIWNEYQSKNPHLKGWRTYNSQFSLHLKKTFGDKEPKDIIQLDVDRLRLKLLKKKSPQTAKHILSLLRRIINFGVRKQLCSGLGFEIQMPAVHNEKTEDLTPDEIGRLLKAIEQDDHLQAGSMMKMAMFTGLRRGEMFKLKWDDINFDRGFILLKDPKPGPDQKIPLNDATRELLDSHPKTSKYVFPGRKGGRRKEISRFTRKLADDAELPEDFRPLHGLRHVYASMLASSGQVDMYTLQKLLTHKDPTMTQRYAHLRDDALQRAAEVAGGIISNAMNGGIEKASKRGEKK